MNCSTALRDHGDQQVQVGMFESRQSDRLASWFELNWASKRDCTGRNLIAAVGPPHLHPVHPICSRNAAHHTHTHRQPGGRVVHRRCTAAGSARTRRDQKFHWSPPPRLSDACCRAFHSLLQLQNRPIGGPVPASSLRQAVAAKRPARRRRSHEPPAMWRASVSCAQHPGPLLGPFEHPLPSQA